MQAKKVKVGDTISVYWPDDRVWYEGEVLSTDEASDTCEVLYEDGEREVLILSKEKYKIKKGVIKGRLFNNVLENDGNVSKQLAAIGAILHDMEDRLPSRGVCSSRVGWWSAWHSGVESAVEAGSVILLARSARELSCQLRPSITTSWWNTKGAEWREHVRTVKTYPELLSCVDDLLKKGVDWSRARQLFPTSNGHSDGGDSHAAGARIIKSDLRTWPNKKARVQGCTEKGLAQNLKAVHKVGDVKTSQEDSECRSKQVETSVEEEMDHSNNDTSMQKTKRDAEKDIRVKDRVSSRTDEQRKTSASTMDEVHREDVRSGNKSSLLTRSRKNLEQEKEQGKILILKEEVQINRLSSRRRAGKAALSEEVEGCLASGKIRNSKEEQYSDEDASLKKEVEKSSFEEAMDEDQGRRNGRKRGARAGKEPPVRGERDAPSSRLRGATKLLSLSKSAKRLRGNTKDVSDTEEESAGEASEEEKSSEYALSGRSEDSEDGEYETHKEGQSATRSLSKRKSNENDHGLVKKTRRDGMRTRCGTVTRRSGSGEDSLTRSAVKSGSDSDDDFFMEGSEESSFSSEDGKETSVNSDGVADDSSSQEKVKQKASSKGKGLASTKVTAEADPNSSDEEVCSVCKFGGAADLMLLCDGGNCEEAFHSFCLKIPLQSIPEEDWLCPFCLYEKSKGAEISKPIKRTPKLRAELIPPMKKVDAIIGWREDPSTMDSEDAEVKKQYLVKWGSLSHRHDTWVPEDWLFFADRVRRQKIINYQRKSSGGDGDDLVDERQPEWVQIDRVIACRNPDGHVEMSPPVQDEGQECRGSKMEYLVKWTNIEYNGSTWEEGNDDKDMQEAIQRFIERHALARRKACSRLTETAVAPTIKQQPKYITGGVLHSYQLHGLKWLLINFQQHKSVILADEMGLGKTIQAASFLMALKHENLSNKPVLVIGPKSTLVGWEQELRQWAADLNSVIYQGEKESRTMLCNYEFYTKERTPLFDVLVTSYDLAMLDNSLLQKFHWSCIIVDEGHRVKNMRSKLGILLKRQTTDFRLLLTGTPVQNTLTELFALLHFLDPREFPDPERSALDFAQVDALCGADSKDEDGMEQQVSRIHELLRPRMLRRLKAEVLNGMIPAKKYQEVRCSLTSLQRYLYKACLTKNHKQLNLGNKTGKKRALNHILMELKMVCNHPYLIPGKEPVDLDIEEAFQYLVAASGKLQFLHKMLPKLKEGGHRVLLFSQMTTLLDILEDFLNHLGYTFCRIDGSTVASERQRQIAEFNSENSSTFIFLISTRAGGLGINLPSADTVIIYDPDFNPFVDLQAQARAHRIGQEKVVLVYQLITVCSVEEKILQRSKQKLAMENLVMSSSDKETAQDVHTLLLHGASKVFKDHDLEATSVKWTDDNLEVLLDRDISDFKDVKEGGAGYLGAIQEAGGVLGGLPVDTSPNVKSGRGWEEILGELAEQEREAEEGNLGRGKRIRNKIQYSFEPNIEAPDEDEAPDAGEDDPDCSGGSSSGSESDVSLDDEREGGSRGQLTKSKSMKLEQEAIVPSFQLHPLLNPSSQIPQQLPNQNSSYYPPTVPQLSTHLQNLSESPKLIPPSAWTLPVFNNQPSSTQPITPTPLLSRWNSSPFLTGSGLPPGLNLPHLASSNRPLWNDLSHSPGTSQGTHFGIAKPSWEMLSPRIPSLADSSVSVSTTHLQVQAPMPSATEASKTIHPQFFGSSGPYYSRESEKPLYSSTVFHDNVDVKVKQVSSSRQQMPPSLSVGSTMKSTEAGNQRVILPLETSISPARLSSSYGSAQPMPISHSLPYITNGKAPDASLLQVNLSDNAVVRGGYWEQGKEQTLPTDFESLGEVLQRTGSLLTGANKVSTLGAPSQILQDGKDMTLEDALRRTGSMLTGTKQVSPRGPLSQLLQDVKDMSFQGVLQRTGTMHMSLEEVLQRTGSVSAGTKQALSPGGPSQIFQGARDLSLEETLRQSWASLSESKPGPISEPHSQVLQDTSYISSEGLQRTISMTAGKQAVSSGSLSQAPQEVQTAASIKVSPKVLNVRPGLVPVKSEIELQAVKDKPTRSTGPAASSDN